VPGNAWRNEIQVRATGALLNLTTTGLSRDEMPWPAQAVQAVVAAT